MSREKQISEMSTLIYENRPIKDIWNEDADSIAKTLYNAGYRKQSEGEWKHTEEPMGWHDVDCVECSVCGESWVMNDNLDFDLIVEYWHYCPNCGAKMKGGAE